MKKQLGIAALGLAGLAAGASAGLVLTGGTGDASAQETPTTTADTTAPDASGEERPDPSSWLAEALARLVEDGTITQAQADAVTTAIAAARPAHDGPGGRGPWGRGGPGGFDRGFGLDAAATALGLSAEELRTELRDGKTIAEVAQEQGLELTTVTEAIVSAHTERVQEKVTAGDMTQAEADEAIAAFSERVDDIVNKTQPIRPGRDRTETDTTTDS